MRRLLDLQSKVECRNQAVEDADHSITALVIASPACTVKNRILHPQYQWAPLVSDRFHCRNWEIWNKDIHCNHNFTIVQTIVSEIIHQLAIEIQKLLPYGQFSMRPSLYHEITVFPPLGYRHDDPTIVQPSSKWSFHRVDPLRKATWNSQTRVRETLEYKGGS